MKGAINLKRAQLKVLDDFYLKEFKEGDIVPRFEGKYKILNMNYQNDYGTFILCHLVEEQDDSKNESRWICEKGVLVNDDNPYEIVGSIHIPNYRNLLAGPGFFVKNHQNNAICGFSYNETWNLLFQYGARNAEASKSRSGQFQTRLIDTIDELPSLDSHYWKIPAYNENGEPFAPFSKRALREVEKAIKYVNEGIR